MKRLHKLIHQVFQRPGAGSVGDTRAVAPRPRLREPVNGLLMASALPDPNGNIGKSVNWVRKVWAVLCILRA